MRLWWFRQKYIEFYLCLHSEEVGELKGDTPGIRVKKIEPVFSIVFYRKVNFTDIGWFISYQEVILETLQAGVVLEFQEGGDFFTDLEVQGGGKKVSIKRYSVIQRMVSDSIKFEAPL